MIAISISKYIPVIVAVLLPFICADKLARIGDGAVCKLLQLTNDRHKLNYCCSPSLMESRKDISNDQQSTAPESNGNPTLTEYNFVVNVMRQVVGTSTMMDSDADVDTQPTKTMAMDKICPTSESTIKSFDMDFFTNLSPHVDLKNIVVKSVSYFSNSDYCTLAPTVDDLNVRYDENDAKELLDKMLLQIYQGVPYCEYRTSLDFDEILHSKKQTPKMHISMAHKAHLGVVGMKAEEPPTTTATPKTVPYLPGYRAWLATFISIIVISTISIAMIVIVGLRKNIKVYRYVLEFFVASAVAALLTDSLLHLYPHSLGVDEHDEHAHKNESIYSASNYLWKGIIIVTTLYLFYLLEYLMLIIPKFIGTSGNHHHHHHHHHDHFHQPQQNNEKIIAEKENKQSYIMLENENNHPPTADCKVVCTVDDHMAQHRVHSGVPIDCIEHIQEVHAIEIDEATVDRHSPATHTNLINGAKLQSGTHTLTNESPATIDESKNTPAKSGIVSKLMKIDKVVWMLTIGDALHNCIDGIIIASQFSSEWPEGLYKGVMTSVAILCHEVPHEVGDYAAMLASGLSVRKAIGFNVVATLACLFGGVIGCGLGTAVRTSWIEPIVAGIFVYIALTVLMPNLIKSLETANSPFKLFLCHTFGYFFGAAVLITIAFHENSIMPHHHH